MIELDTIAMLLRLTCMCVCVQQAEYGMSELILGVQVSSIRMSCVVFTMRNLRYSKP